MKKQEVPCICSKSRNAVKFARKQRAEKPCKQVASWISRGNKRYEQSAVPEEMQARVSGRQRVSSHYERNGYSRVGKERRYKCVESSLVGSSARLDVAVFRSFLPHRFSFSLLPRLSCRKLFAPVSSATCTRARKTLEASQARQARFALV